MGAVKPAHPIRATIAAYKQSLAENGQTLEGTPFEGMPDNTLLEVLYELPDGGGIIQVVGRINTAPIRLE